MSWWLAFAVFLYFLCAVLIVAEVFVPSGGLISICAMACLIGGVAIFFQQSMVLGYIGMGVAIVLVPTVVIFAYKIFPKSKFGKSVTLAPPVRKAGDAIPDTDRLKGLLGQQGEVLTPLRPVGSCEFGERRVECVAESGYVGTGKTVEVIRVEGTQLTVRVVDEIE